MKTVGDFFIFDEIPFMRTLFILLLFLIGCSSFAQSADNLKADIKKLYQANYLMDFEVMASYSYPKMVEIIDYATLLEKMEKHYENDEYRLRLQLETVPFQYTEIKVIKGRSFCVITCRNPMRYTFETKLTAETAAVKAESLKEINKTKEVTFEPKRNSFNVRKITTYLAVADETTENQWKFFNFDDSVQYESFLSIFGVSLKKELGL